MGVLTKLSSKVYAGTPSATDDYWYQPFAQLALSGIRISPEIAFRSAGVYASVKVIAETIGALPLITYERQPDGGKKRAPEHELFELLRYEPNAMQTAYEFWRLTIVVALLWGTSFSEIVVGRRGFADQLMPLPPNRTRKIVQEGRIVIETANPQGEKRILLQDEVFIISGLSLDGVTALGIPEVARDSIGLAIALEQWGARFFSQSSQPGGTLEHPSSLTDEATKRLAQSWQTAHAGLANAHKVVVLEEGMEYKPTVMSARNAQMIESRKYQLEEIARYFRLPPHKIGILDRATFSNIEEQGLEFVTDTIQPWVVAIEQRIRKQLLLAPQRFLSEFLLDSLLRGRATERAEVLAMYVDHGIISQNEARAVENLNPIPGLDTPRRSANIGSEPPPAAAVSAVSEQATRIADQAATRLIFKETTVVAKFAARTGTDRDALQIELRRFYDLHAKAIAQAMQIPLPEADAWCERQLNDVLNFGPSVAEKWMTDKPRQLVGIALGVAV